MLEIFISYANEDKELSIDFEHRLKQSGLIVHRDKSTLKAGDEWREKVLAKVRTCDVFILLWSKNSAKSRPVMEEILEALRHERRIIPCLLDETSVTSLLDDKHYFRLSNLANQYDEFLSNLDLESNSLPAGISQDIRYALSTYRSLALNHFGKLQVLFEGKEGLISQLYVELNLCVGIDASEQVGGQLPRQLFSYLQEHGENIVLVGHPGSGKTSTLRFLMYLWSTSDTKTIAVFVRLKDFEPRFHANFEDFILEQFYTMQNIQSRHIYEKANVFKDFRWMILMDGLDEVPAEIYNTFIKQLKEFEEIHRDYSLVITTRIDGFRDQREPDFLDWQFFSIARLDKNRIEQFINNWFSDSEAQNNLLKKLIDTPRLWDLAGRAFLLALICLVYDEDGDIGQNRSSLYERATYYLEKSRIGGQLSKVLTIRRSVLKEIALWYLRLNVSGLNVRILSSIISEIIMGEINLPPKTFIDELVNDTGLLQNFGNMYTFTHKSFQEYYSALGLKDMQTGKDLMLAYCNVAHWEEPIRLFVGSISSNVEQQEFVRALWKKNPALALRTATEFQNLAASFLTDLLEETQPDERVRMINEVTASLRTLDKMDAQRIAIETLAPLFSVEVDSSVLYFGIQLLNEFDPLDSGQVMHNTFYKNANILFNTLTSDSKYKFEFVKISGGEFVMGDDESQDKIEHPAHRVKLRDFSIAKYQLTNLAYETITGNNKREDGISDADDEPVGNINWFDAYICALKVGCRLPTEAEWEYAARAGSKDNWCFGNDVSELKKYSNYEDTGLMRTWKVGSGLPNNWNLYDVHGNVWEWCQDWLAPYTSGFLQIDPKGSPTGTRRVRRGGGHAYHARGCRSAFRWGNDPSYSFKDIGVRFAKETM